MRRLIIMFIWIVTSVVGVTLVASTIAPSVAEAKGKKKAKVKAKHKAKAKHKKAKHKKAKHKKKAKHHAHANRAIARTHRAIVKVGAAVKTSGKGKVAFRKAVARQHAARKARRNGHHRLAIHLTRKARLHLKKASAAAGMEAPPEEIEGTTEEDEALADGDPVPESDGDDLIKESEDETKEADVLLQDENFGDTPEADDTEEVAEPEPVPPG